MEKGFYKKLKKSLILMIVVISLLSLYIGLYREHSAIYIFTGVIIPLATFRLYWSKKILKKQSISWPESVARNLQASATGFIPVYLYTLNQDDLAIIAYILVCSISSGVISLYSEKFKSGVVYILLVSTPLVLYTLFQGPPEHKYISGLVMLYLVGLLNNLREMAAVQNELIDAKQEAEKLAKSKSEFLAIKSHEIRTPLNGMMGMIELLKDTPMSEDQKYHFDTIVRSSHDLEVVINDILSFSKIEAGKMELEKIPFDPQSLVQDLRKLFASEARKKDIKLEAKIFSDFPQSMVGDPMRLKQVLSNFVSNAVKFTPAKGTINIEAKRINTFVQFSVKDSGIGMSEEQKQKLFKPFSQADMSTTRKYGRTGLGLSICKSLIEHMQGSIRVQSEEGQGSIFVIQLPLIEVCATTWKKVERPKIDESDFSKHYPHQILLAEDNKVNQMVAKKVLQKFGYEVDIADNGKIAVDMARKKDYTLILMDMQMPEMDGVTATLNLKRETSCPSIVGFTANVLHEDKQRCLEAGMISVITKPLNISDIKRILIDTYEDKKAA